MKKLLSMLLCLVLVCGMLVSCDEDRIFGSYLPNYDDYKPEEVEKLTLNLYIITDDITSQNARDTVELNINLHTTSNYDTELKVHYLTASQYQSKVTEEVNSSDEDSANIILINSLSMMTNLVNSGKLADLTDYLNSDKYGKLNVNIAEALLEGSKINGKYYAIPNNHVIDDYEYLVIDKFVIQEFKEIPSEVANYKSIDDAAELIEKLEAAGYDYTDYLYTRTGPYELKAELEATGNICNVIKYPTVNASVAFSSAFAVVDREEKYNERAMQIIYAINMDSELRNLLQYGVVDINYTIDADGNIVRHKGENNTYSMNLLYTGNVFAASYCSEIGWTNTVAENGKLQNKEAVAE